MSEFTSSKLNVKFVKNCVVFHTFINLFFKLFYLDSNFAYVLFGFSKFINSLGNLVNLFCDLGELSRNFVSFILSF